MAELSPAAQAALDTFDDRYELCGPFDGNWQELCLAAALRAAADQIISSVPPPCADFDEYAKGFLAAHVKYRRDLLAIAAELEGTTHHPLEPNDLSHLSDEEFLWNIALAPQGFHGL